MGRQTSRKTGLHSSAEKARSSRHGTEPMPATSPVAGAYGRHKPTRTTDVDASFIHDSKHKRRGEDEGGTRKGG
ncbi:MAG TPA: hypothetical protein VFD58_16455 [Blastocatellia bacterium]|nr:hypothetical protein [Blastocatellia bacterium]